MDKTEFNLIMLKLEALEQQMANGKAAAGAAGGAAGGASSSGSATGDGNSLKAEDAEKAVTFNPRRRSKSATDVTTTAAAAAAAAGKEEVSPMIAPRTRRTRSDHGSMHLNTVKESSLSCR